MTDPANAGSMTVGMLTGGPVIRVAADADLHEVAEALVDASVGALVIGEEDAPTAIVSERDLVGALAERRDPSKTRAGDIAHTTLVWCPAGATLAEVAGLMMDRYVRHVLVEEDGKLVGIVSARDVLGAYAGFDLAEEEEED